MSKQEIEKCEQAVAHSKLVRLAASCQRAASGEVSGPIFTDLDRKDHKTLAEVPRDLARMIKIANHD